MRGAATARILIVDDDRLVRATISFLLGGMKPTAMKPLR